jgi:eukaryotic-like serine/threonine-protein kinase
VSRERNGFDETRSASPEGAAPPGVRGRLEAGQRVGRYTVLGPLGAGGMGVVVLAHDPQLQRQVALKLLHQRLGTFATSRGRARMQREAQALAKLSHPNVVAIHDVGTVQLPGEPAPSIFLAMEYVPGGTLGDVLGRYAHDVDDVLDLFIAAGRGLAAAHDAGLVHRDFKPDNVLVGEDGRPRVMDFGLARAAADEPPEAERAPAVSHAAASDSPVLSAPLTVTGSILGTPAYMAPEQHLGRPTGPATDQFAFCVALHEALHGERPFEGAIAAVLAHNVTSGIVRRPSSDGKVPPRVMRIIARGLSVEPTERWPGMNALLDALARARARGRRRRMIALASVGVLVATAAVAIPSAPPDVCALGTERWHGVWDDARRDELRAAFERSRLPIARQTAPRVEAALDRYVAEWSASFERACRSPHADDADAEAFDVRMACLDERRGAAAAFIVMALAADEAAARDAAAAAYDLPPIAACDASRSRSSAGRPSSRAQAQAVAAARATLARARVHHRAGELREAVALAREAVGAADGTHDAFVVAEARLLLGELLRSVHPAEARPELEAAYLAAVDADADDLAVDAAISLASVVDPSERLQWTRHARARVARLPADDPLVARVTMAEALASWGEGDLAGARTQLERAAEHADRLGPSRRAELYAYLGDVVRATGELRASIDHYEKAQAVIAEAFGPDHPAVVPYLRIRAVTHRQLGENDEALAAQEKIVDATIRALGEDHPRVGQILGEMSVSYARTGDMERAEIFFRRAYEHFGEGTLGSIQALSNWGVSLDRAGRFEESVAKHRAVLDYLSANPSVDPQLYAFAHDNLGSALQGTERFEEALGYHLRALEMLESLLGPSHPDVAISLRDQARACIGAGRHTDAVLLLERAERIFAAREGDPGDLAEARWHLARALAAGGEEPDRARGAAQWARDTFAALGDANTDRVAEIDAWLAETATDPIAP